MIRDADTLSDAPFTFPKALHLQWGKMVGEQMFAHIFSQLNFSDSPAFLGEKLIKKNPTKLNI